MGITVEKARRVLKTYRDNNYNASKALQEVGYTKQTSDKASKIIINSAIKKVAKDELKSITMSNNPIASLLGIVGITEQELVNEYMFIVKQNRDLSTKLKAMLPLLAEKGIKWNEEQTNIQVPVLNVTVKDNNMANNKDIAPCVKDDSML